MVPRPVIAAALARARLNPQLQSLLLHWHINTHYHLEVNNTERQVSVNRGVRQGCSSAPLLWATVMVLLLDNLQSDIPLQWIRDHNTIYADDIHVFCTFQTETELNDAVSFFDAIIRAIEELGLALSASKSCLLLKGKGAGFLKWRKTHVKRDQHGHYCLELGEGRHRIPIKKQCLYLGTVLSYDDFQKQTTALRVQAGWKNFRRLQPWLCKKHKIPIAMRLHLFNTCIIPTICYGIFFTGMTQTCIDLILKTFNMMYRRVLGHVPHLTRVTTEAALDCHRIQHPLLTLHQLVEQALAGLRHALVYIPSDDILHITDWTTLQSTRALLVQKLVQPERPRDSGEEAPPHVCGFCSFMTDSSAELQKHYTLVHSQPRIATTKIDFVKDTVQGQPTCFHCGKVFNSWRSFSIHRQYNMCNASELSHPGMTLTSEIPLDFQEIIEAPMETSNDHAALLGRAQVFAAEADYDSVMHDRPLCDFMKTNCIPCCKHVVSLRSLTSHLRANHPGQMQEAIALGIQRTKQHTGDLSPCRFCNLEFKKTHLCPVTTQVAVLEMQTTSTDDPRHFTCFLCQYVAPDRLQLRQHLSTRHKFPCFDWIPARDSLPDQVTCAHCGSVYHSLEVVRKHIIYGHCKQFNPDRPWTQNGTPEMVEHLRLGRVDLLLTDAEMRKALTLRCQFCSKLFSQACNLINHLVVQHAEIAAEATDLQQLLQQRYAPHGCYCMPPVRTVKQTHQCVVFLQLSMMHYNGNQLLTIPLSYDDRACDLMVTHVPIRCIQIVQDCLKSRDFALLQQDPHLLQALKTSCLCCGKPVTLTGPAQEHVLRPHLQQHHAEPRHIIQCLIQMVIYRRKHDHLKHCDWCGTSIEPIDANTEYDDHLAECPVLLHFATWLSIPFLPRHYGSVPRGCLHADAGSARPYGPGLRGTKRPFAEEKTGSNLKTLFAKQRHEGSEPIQTPALDGAASSSSRERLDGTAGSEQLCHLSFHQQGGKVGTFASGKHGLEEGSEGQSGDHATATTPIPVSVEDSSPTSSQTEGMQTGRSTMGVKLAIPVVAEGRIMALSGLEQQEEVPRTGWEGQEHSYGGDAVTPGTTISNGGGSRSDREIPFPTKQIQGCASHPMEIGVGHEKQQATWSDSSFGGMHSVATSVTSHQEASSQSKQDGRRADEDGQVQLQRQRICIRLMELVIHNPNVQCFINTVFVSTWWIHLLCSDFSLTTWGDLTLPMQTLLLTGVDDALCITNHPFFHNMLQQWHTLRVHGQQDSGEFLCFYLGWLGTKLVSQAYQRRYVAETGVVIAEENKGYAPILLHSDLWNDLPSTPSLKAVVDRWTEMNGMTTSLTIASTLVCFQVCRFQDMQQNDCTSFDFADLTAYLNVFTNSQMDTARIPYRVIALVSYTGDSMHGHYTCAVSFTNSFGEDGWLYHDDNKPPQVWHIIPEWYTWTITHIWLVRQDKFAGWVEPPMTMSNPDLRARALERVLSSLKWWQPIMMMFFSYFPWCMLRDNLCCTMMCMNHRAIWWCFWALLLYMSFWH